MAKKKLAAYQAKRNFKMTLEPSGSRTASMKRAEYPRFVFQKHAASRLRWARR
jgi:bifunctional non-homologous end joining protein LigD